MARTILRARYSALLVRDMKIAVVARDRKHALVLMDVEAVVFGDAPIVLQRFGAAGLFVERGHRQAADFEQLRRGEEHHVRRIVVERIHDAALFDQDRVEAALLQLDAAGQAGGPGANHDDVEAAPPLRAFLPRFYRPNRARRRARRDLCRPLRPCRDGRRLFRRRPARPSPRACPRGLSTSGPW